MIGRWHRGHTIVRARSAPPDACPNAAPGWVAHCPCGERIWGAYQSQVKASIDAHHRNHANGAAPQTPVTGVHRPL